MNFGGDNSIVSQCEKVEPPCQWVMHTSAFDTQAFFHTPLSSHLSPPLHPPPFLLALFGFDSHAVVTAHLSVWESTVLRLSPRKPSVSLTQWLCFGRGEGSRKDPGNGRHRGRACTPLPC